MVTHVHTHTHTQENLAKGPYHTEAVKALRSHRPAISLLGEPIRVQALRLGDKENKVTTEHAQVHVSCSIQPT